MSHTKFNTVKSIYNSVQSEESEASRVFFLVEHGPKKVQNFVNYM